MSDEAHSFLGQLDDEDERAFCLLVGLAGTFWHWLDTHANLDDLSEQLHLTLRGRYDMNEFITRINTYADRAAAENYASRRMAIKLDDNRLTLHVAAHPHTQLTVCNFLFQHLADCDKDCEMIEDAELLVSEGYRAIPELVTDGIWTDTERLRLIGHLDQLAARIADVRS